MALGRLGVWYSTDKLNGSQLGDLVKAVEGNGYSALWYPESRGYESMSLPGVESFQHVRADLESARSRRSARPQHA